MGNAKKFHKGMWRSGVIVPASDRTQAKHLQALIGGTREEAQHLIDMVSIALLYSLIQRGTIRLPFINLRLAVNKEGELQVYRAKSNIINDAIKEFPETPRGRALRKLLLPQMIDRLQLIQEELYDKITENPSNEL